MHRSCSRLRAAAEFEPNASFNFSHRVVSCWRTFTWPWRGRPSNRSGNDPARSVIDPSGASDASGTSQFWVQRRVGLSAADCGIRASPGHSLKCRALFGCRILSIYILANPVIKLPLRISNELTFRYAKFSVGLICLLHRHRSSGSILQLREHELFEYLRVVVVRGTSRPAGCGNTSIGRTARIFSNSTRSARCLRPVSINRGALPVASLAAFMAGLLAARLICARTAWSDFFISSSECPVAAISQSPVKCG